MEKYNEVTVYLHLSDVEQAALLALVNKASSTVNKTVENMVRDLIINSDISVDEIVQVLSVMPDGWRSIAAVYRSMLSETDLKAALFKSTEKESDEPQPNEPAPAPPIKTKRKSPDFEMDKTIRSKIEAIEEGKKFSVKEVKDSLDTSIPYRRVWGVMEKMVIEKELACEKIQKIGIRGLSKVYWRPVTNTPEKPAVEPPKPKPKPAPKEPDVPKPPEKTSPEPQKDLSKMFLENSDLIMHKVVEDYGARATLSQIKDAIYDLRYALGDGSINADAISTSTLEYLKTLEKRGDLRLLMDNKGAWAIRLKAGAWTKYSKKTTEDP